MAAPTETSPPSEIIAYMLYTVARLEAEPDLAHHALVAQPPIDKLLKCLGVRISAHNAVLKSEAKADFARDKMLDTLTPLSLHAAALLGSKSHPQYLRIYTRTPIAFAAVPQKDLPKEMAEIEKALRHEATPAAVLKHGQAFIEARKAWLAAEEVETKAQDALKWAAEGIRAAKKECVVATSRVRSRLSDHFAGESKKVLRFFRATSGKVKAAVVAAVPTVEAEVVGEREAELV